MEKKCRDMTKICQQTKFEIGQPVWVVKHYTQRDIIPKKKHFLDLRNLKQYIRKTIKFITYYESKYRTVQETE